MAIINKDLFPEGRGTKAVSFAVSIGLRQPFCFIFSTDKINLLASESSGLLRR
jgi:hypothetical protein